MTRLTGTGLWPYLFHSYFTRIEQTSCSLCLKIRTLVNMSVCISTKSITTLLLLSSLIPFSTPPIFKNSYKKRCRVVPVCCPGPVQLLCPYTNTTVFIKITSLSPFLTYLVLATHSKTLTSRPCSNDSCRNLFKVLSYMNHDYFRAVPQFVAVNIAHDWYSIFKNPYKNTISS